MANEAEMSGWSDLLHSSSKLLQHSSPFVHFPPLQRNLDQLESLSKKLKVKTLRPDSPSQSTAATRLLAREGINAEQLARDLKSFEIKTTFDDVFPTEATAVEEYLRQVHEMALASTIHESQKDNLRSFNSAMNKVMQEDWKKEKRDFLHSLGRLSMLPRPGTDDSLSLVSHPGQIVSLPKPSSGSADWGIYKTTVEKKASVYAEVISRLNRARERGLPFKPATELKGGYEKLNLEAGGGKSVNMQKIWSLVQSLMGEDNTPPQQNAARGGVLLLIATGAGRHLELGHERYMMDTIQNHPAQAALGGAVSNLKRVHAFLRVRLKDYGVLDFDGDNGRRQPPVDTTWQQIYFCLRSGYYEEARDVALSSHISVQFAPLLSEWVTTGGVVTPGAAMTASEECEKLLRMGERAGRLPYDKKKLLLYAIISGCRRQIDSILRDLPSLFTTIEDFLWFNLSAVRHQPSGEGLVPYTLGHLQAYINKFEPGYYTKKGKDPLVYPYVLLLTLQFLPAVLHLSKETGAEGYCIDAVHISIVLADHSVLAEGCGGSITGLRSDVFSEVSSLISHYGSEYLRLGNLSAALEYFAQAAAALGGGRLSQTGKPTAEQQRQKSVMLRQLLTDILLRDGGTHLLLGSRGTGEHAELTRFMNDGETRRGFLFEAALRCEEAGRYENCVEILKRVGAYSTALETINKCFSEAICDFSHGRLDGESRISGLLQSAKEVLETSKYSPETREQERKFVMEQEVVLRQLERILTVHRLASSGKSWDVLREASNTPFFNSDVKGQTMSADEFQSLSPHVRSCVPDLIRISLSSLDSLPPDASSDSSLYAFRTKIVNFVANNLGQNWPSDLYEKVAHSV